MRSAASLVLVASVLAALAPAEAAPPPDRKTLDRSPDPVVVRGRRLDSLLGARTETLGLFAFSEGRWAPLPYQIDERGEDGAFLYPFGERSPRPADAGKLKERDELVFMARDAGDRWAGPGAAPPPPGSGAGVEIALSEPRPRAQPPKARPAPEGRAWAYLFAFAGEFPRSERDYVSYDHDAGRVRARSYTMTFAPGEDRIYFQGVSVPASAGGSGANLVDRLKIRIHLRTHFWISLVFDEDDWDSAVRRWIDGPVRVVREVDNALTFLGVDVAPRLLIESTFYAEHHAAPTVIHQTVDVPSIAREAYVETQVDLSPEAKGMRYERKGPKSEGPWRAIDGRTTEDERDLSPRRPPWHFIAGDQGQMVWRMELPEPIAPVTSLGYADDESEPDPPERFPGRVGALSYRFDLFALPKGTYRMWTYFLFPPERRAGVERDCQRMIDRPLEVSVRPLP